MAKPVHFQEIRLPQSYQTVDFIGDMHLDAKVPKTFAAWQRYMQSTPADAIFILGDMFDVWMGDDVLTTASPVGDFERQCMAVTTHMVQRAHVYFIHGNRDFALRAQTLKAAGMELLSDPTLLCWGDQRVIVTHGDLLCTQDTKYQKYRKVVHNPIVQKMLLCLPLKTRLAIGQKMRQKSMAAQKGNQPEIMDVDTKEVERWFHEAQTNLMIHGHTHRPADHTLSQGQKRIVLSDWNLDANKNQRAEVLRWSMGGDAGFQRLSLLRA